MPMSIVSLTADHSCGRHEMARTHPSAVIPVSVPDMTCLALWENGLHIVFSHPVSVKILPLKASRNKSVITTNCAVSMASSGSFLHIVQGINHVAFEWLCWLIWQRCWRI